MMLMTSMPRSSRQKSCTACAAAKRRCFPQLPRCPRCASLGHNCVYKNTPLRSSGPIPIPTVAAELAARPEGLGGLVPQESSVAHDQEDVESRRNNTTTWPTAHPPFVATASGVDVAQQPLQQHQDAAFSAPEALQLPPRTAAESAESTEFPVASAIGGAEFEVPPPTIPATEGGSGSDTDLLLRQTQTQQPQQHSSWAGPLVAVPEHPALFPGSVSPSLLSINDLVSQNYPTISSADAWSTAVILRSLSAWPRDFVRKLETPFISVCSYDGGDLPLPLRDAFCACAGYVAKTATNKSIVLDVIQRTSDRLLSKDPLSLPTEDHLSSLQALLLLHTVQLLDGDALQRRQAEAQRPQVEQWAYQLHARVAIEDHEHMLEQLQQQQQQQQQQQPPHHHHRHHHNHYTEANPSPPPPTAPISRRMTTKLRESARRTVLMTLFAQSAYDVINIGVCTMLPVLAALPFSTTCVAASGRSSSSSSPSPTIGDLAGEEEKLMSYGSYVVEWKTKHQNARLNNPELPPGRIGSSSEPPLDQFRKLLLAPCLGVAYRDCLKFSEDEDLF